MRLGIADAANLAVLVLALLTTGAAPTTAQEFLADENLHRRRILIDSLLERDELADYRTMAWSELLVIKAEATFNL